MTTGSARTRMRTLGMLGRESCISDVFFPFPLSWFYIFPWVVHQHKRLLLLACLGWFRDWYLDPSGYLWRTVTLLRFPCISCPGQGPGLGTIMAWGIYGTISCHLVYYSCPMRHGAFQEFKVALASHIIYKLLSKFFVLVGCNV